MKFVNVRLLVGDIAASIRFWRDVLGLRMTYGDEAIGYAYFETDSAGVELMTREGFAAALGEAASQRKPEGHPAVEPACRGSAAFRVRSRPGCRKSPPCRRG